MTVAAKVEAGSAADSAEFRRQRWAAWGSTWIAYATYYTGRQGFSVAKKAIQDHVRVSVAALGAIDTAFLAAYAIGQFVSGTLGDRVGARRLIGYGLLLSAAACVAFGASSAALLFGVMFCVNGFAQSTGWPGTTRAMAEWTTPANRGSVMAIWATCYQVGGVVATALAGYMLVHFGWRFCFFGPALLMIGVALLVMAVLRPGPSAHAPVAADGEVGANAPDAGRAGPATQQPLSDAELHDVRRRAQRAVLTSPVLWSYGASYFFIKFIRYSLLFWLPYYLAKRLAYDEGTAATMSMAFQAGGIGGVVIIGVLSDRLRRYSRSLLSAAWLGGLAVALVAYAKFGATGMLVNVLCLAAVGALLFGPDSLISGAAAQDAGGPHAAAMATGFVDGVGSFGAMLEGVVVPAVSKHYGWDSVFWLFVAMAVLAAVALLPSVKRAPAPRAA